jgi:uracil-DNA glycosylase
MKPALNRARNNPKAASITSLVPPRSTIAALRKAASACTACDLWRTATQTVFGEGTSKAMIMIVGEQPGDQEDRVGRPFVGPAGKLLNEALAEAGIDRTSVYVTNVVKHSSGLHRNGARNAFIRNRASSRLKLALPGWKLSFIR